MGCHGDWGGRPPAGADASGDNLPLPHLQASHDQPGGERAGGQPLAAGDETVRDLRLSQQVCGHLPVVEDVREHFPHVGKDGQDDPCYSCLQCQE